MAFKPQVLGTAVIGISGIVGVSLRGLLETFRLLGLARFTEELRLFDGKAEALAWLSQL
jgi:hypothetical protein